jgi:hypothetical protein
MVLISLKEYEDLTGDRGLDAQAELLSHAGTGFGGMLLLLPVAILYYLLILQQLHVPFYILGLLLTSVLQSFPSRDFPRPFSQPNPSSKQHFSHCRCTPNPKTEKEKKTDSRTNREISEPLQEEKAQRSKSRTPDPSAIRCHIHGNQSSYQLPKERRKLSEIRPDSLNYSLGNITAAHARAILEKKILKNPKNRS